MHNLLNQLRIKHNVVGCVFASDLRNNKHIFTSGDSIIGTPVTPDMHYRIGGQAIPIITTMLLMTVDKGLTTLDTTIDKYVEGIPNGDKITMEQLSNMTAGLPDYISDENFYKQVINNLFSEIPIDEILSIIRKSKPLYEPGTWWNFGHMTNVLLLCLSLEQIYKDKFWNILDKMFINPLGLTNTKYEHSSIIQSPVLHSYSESQCCDITKDGIRYEDSTYWNPSWGAYVTRINSSANDMLIIAKTICTGKLISKKSYENLFSKKTIGLADNTKDKYYAMGIAIRDYGIPGVKFINAQFGGYEGSYVYIDKYDLTLHLQTNTILKSSHPSSEDIIFTHLIKEYISKLENSISSPGYNMIETFNTSSQYNWKNNLLIILIIFVIIFIIWYLYQKKQL